MCDSVNHTHFLKEDHLPDWVCRDKHSNKGDRVEAFHIAGLFAVERAISSPYSIHWCHQLCNDQSGNKNWSVCEYWMWQITDNIFAVSLMLWCHHMQGPSGFRYSLSPTSARCCTSSWTWLVSAKVYIQSWAVWTELLCSSICIIN